MFLENDFKNQKTFLIGTHSAFREMIADYEFKREKTIKDAECFMKYEISFIEQCFHQDMNALQDEYEVITSCGVFLLRVLTFSFYYRPSENIYKIHSLLQLKTKEDKSRMIQKIIMVSF